MVDDKKLRKAREGDLKLIEDICAGTSEAVYRFTYYKVQNREEAEDITQETYVRAISHILRGNTKIEKCTGFLKTVSLNIIRDRWRKRKRQGISVNFDNINPEEIATEDPAEAGIQQELVKDALSRLSEEQRTVIELRIIKGYSVSETAAMMNKKEGTIRVLQYRALQTLAAILKDSDC